MSVLKILHYPDTRLRKIANPVGSISKKTKKIINNMFETMYFNKGIGLAATQVNINQQIIVIDLCNTNQTQFVLINPKIIKKSGLINMVEGCLSIPKVYETIPRSKTIIVQSLNENGNLFKIAAHNLLSICIQHEIDHLLGKLFIDHLNISKIKEIHENMMIKNK